MSRELKDNMSEKNFETFSQIIHTSSTYEAKYLFEASSHHADHSLEQFKQNPIIDFETAEKLAALFITLEKNWDSYNEKAQEYFKAAMYYFAISEDDEPDFTSFTGFDDDVAIINACLKYAELDDMIIDLKR
jgi:uncharacterized membrane protein YkvA (DUF1232 family)